MARMSIVADTDDEAGKAISEAVQAQFKIRDFITEGLRQNAKETSETQGRITKGGWQNVLEWNLSEEMARLEIRGLELQKLLDYLDGHTIANPETVEVLRSELLQVEEALLGHGSFGSEEGPWDAHSTSAGHNRLAIIRANSKRWFRGILQKILKMAGALEKKS